MVLRLWLVERSDGLPNFSFLAAVVCAATEEEARLTLPDRAAVWGDHWIRKDKRDKLKVTCLGIAGDDVEPGPILANYLAT